MGENSIIVHLGLGDMLSKAYPEFEGVELKKNLGDKKELPVKEVYNYLIDTETDSLNPQDYDMHQKDLVKLVQEEYNPALGVRGYIPSFEYRTNRNGEEFMYFNERLSDHSDAFIDRMEPAGGNLEKVVGYDVYLRAAPQESGGKD